MRPAFCWPCSIAAPKRSHTLNAPSNWSPASPPRTSISAFFTGSKKIPTTPSQIYGIASTPDRFLTRELGARTPIRGLYLAGQDAASLGVVGALYGGVIGASAAAGRNFFSVVSKPRDARNMNGPHGFGAVA